MKLKTRKMVFNLILGLTSVVYADALVDKNNCINGDANACYRYAVSVSTPGATNENLELAKSLYKLACDGGVSKACEALNSSSEEHTISRSVTSTVPSISPADSANKNIPEGWNRHSFAGISFFTPAEWKIAKNNENGLMLADFNKKAQTSIGAGIMLDSHDPRTEGTPPGAEKSNLPPVIIGNKTFSHMLLSGKMDGRPSIIHMLVSDKKANDGRYLIFTAMATNIAPNDSKKILAQVIASLQSAAKSTQKSSRAQTAENGFVTFTLPAGWKVLQDTPDYLTLCLKSYAAYLNINIGTYAESSMPNDAGSGKPTTIFGVPARVYNTGQTDITVIQNGFGTNVKGLVRTYVLDLCTLDGTPVVAVETATPDWLKTIGFDALEKSIALQFTDRVKSCKKNTQKSKKQYVSDERQQTISPGIGSADVKVDGKLHVDLYKNGQMETIAWKKFKTTELGDYYQLLIIGSDGKVVWQGPKEANEDNPLVFYSLDTGVSLPAIAMDYDQDGQVELLAPMAQSDVSPTYYRKLRWRGNYFESLEPNALMLPSTRTNHFVWKTTRASNGIWVSKLLPGIHGEVKAEVTELSGGSNVKMGTAILHLDRQGAEILRWLEPLSPVSGEEESSSSQTVSEASTSSTPPIVTDRNTYIARISRGDHYNSRGYHLGNMKSILRQDRAYFYKGIGDEEDRPDLYFKSRKNRAAMEHIAIHPIGISYSKLKSLILHHNPLIEVHVKHHSLDIKVLERDQSKPTAP